MDRPSSNLFVRTLIVLFCAFLGAMVVFRFYTVTPVGEISGGLLILLAFVLVLVLSELFDNFSVGKLVTMSRSLREKEEQKAELKKENSELRSQLIIVTTSVSQRQTSNTIVGLPEQLAELLTVKKAGDEEIAAKRNEENLAPPASAAIPVPSVPVEAPFRRLDMVKVESQSIAKYVASSNLSAYSVILEAKLSMQLSGLDPITNATPIFDAYMNTMDAEIFMEVRAYGTLGISFRDRLYVMLAKLHHYKSLKKTNAYLVLIVTKVPDDANRSSISSIERVTQTFEPAITSGLLRVYVAEFNAEEAAGLYKYE